MAIERPKQGVILCGGLGTRMRPFTDTMPKPMVPVNGRPFLEYLIRQLREQGLERVLLLTGYRGEMIQEHFGNGTRYGVGIQYSHGPVEWDTGRRIWEARDQLEDRFLLLYSDNFTPFNLGKLFAFHAARQPLISLLLQAKQPGNISVNPDGIVQAYDPSRKTPNLGYVEIGYMLVHRQGVLESFEQPDISFSRVLQRLAPQGSIAGLISGDRYHSISDPVRWKLAEQYLTAKRILLIDRDGTINRRPPRGEYTTRWRDVHWIDETVEAMRKLAGAGYRFVVLSNQAGIARGMVSAEDVAAINQQMVQELKGFGIEILDVYVCPHHWEDHCECRKPAPGMLFRASREHSLRLDRTVYIGDDPRDALAAFNAGCLSVLIGSEREMDPGSGVRPSFTAASLPEAVSWITGRFDAWADDRMA